MTSKDAILASMDVLSALEMTSGDVIVDAKINALNNLHSQKVRALMKSINTLKDQVALMKAQSKDHRRSNLITGMRDKIREQELIVDVLKSELSVKGNLQTEEVNEFIIKKTLGGPKRFRPKTREELQNELIKMEKTYKRRAVLKNNTNTRLGNSNGGSSSAPDSKLKLPLPPAADSGPASPVISPRESGGVLQGQVSELLDEVESLKVALRSRDTNLTSRIEEMDRLRSENRELRRIEEKLIHKERKHRDMKETNRSLLNENEKLKEEFELERAEAIQLKANLNITMDENKIEADSLRSAESKLYDELHAAKQREDELSYELERYKSEVVASR